MKGMEEVGRLFNNNELIVAEVLQSAEVMKASVNLSGAVYGEDPRLRLKVKLFWRRLKAMFMISVKIWLKLFYPIMDIRLLILGIKVPPEQIIEAYRREKAGCDRFVRLAC